MEINLTKEEVITIIDVMDALKDMHGLYEDEEKLLKKLREWAKA